jgi:hypothetical protein
VKVFFRCDCKYGWWLLLLSEVNDARASVVLYETRSDLAVTSTTTPKSRLLISS